MNKNEESRKFKIKNDFSVDEINLLMANENNTKAYKKLSYFRFNALGFT